MQAQLLSFAQSKPDYGVVVADFATFASPRTAQKISFMQQHATEAGSLLGRITLPVMAATTTTKAASSPKHNRLHVSSRELRNLVSAILVH